MAVSTKGGAPVLGLDIGAAFIKAVELRPGKGALAVTGVGVLPTPPGCIVNDEIVDPVVLAAAVKQLLSESGIKSKNVVASVAGQSAVVVRVIEVPRMNDKELAETMRWEIDRHIPFAPDEVVKDFSAIHRPGDDPNSPNMAVLLAVAQNGLVGGMLQTILNAGLTPVAIDVEALAGARALLDADDRFATQNVALVNIGATKTDVGIYESGTLAFPRTIPLAGNAMTEAVAAALQIDAADAERLKKQHGAVPADAVARFGTKAEAAGEEHYDFGEFGADTFGEPAAPPTFGAPAAGAAAAPGFAETTEGPVFGAPFAATADGPVFGEPFAATTEGPVFGEPTVAPVPEPAPEPYASFDLPDVGPANAGPPDFPATDSDTPPLTTPAEPVALTPDEAPLRAPSVPEVVTEAGRHRAEISDAFMPVVAELAGEIKRSLEYYASRANNASVDRVVVFGGTANLTGLASFLEAELGAPVQLAGLPDGVTLASSLVGGDYLQQAAPLLPVAIGLAAYNAIAVEQQPVAESQKQKAA
jgi:type IV pilus assembly protein PilM